MTPPAVGWPPWMKCSKIPAVFVGDVGRSVDPIGADDSLVGEERFGAGHDEVSVFGANRLSRNNYIQLSGLLVPQKIDQVFEGRVAGGVGRDGHCRSLLRAPCSNRSKPTQSGRVVSTCLRHGLGLFWRYRGFRIIERKVVRDMGNFNDPRDETPGVPGEWGVDTDPYTEDDSIGQGDDE